MRFPSADEWVRIQFAATPPAALLADRDASERERTVALVGADVRSALTEFSTGEAFAFPQEVLVALATA